MNRGHYLMIYDVLYDIVIDTMTVSTTQKVAKTSGICLTNHTPPLPLPLRSHPSIETHATNRPHRQTGSIV